MQFVIVTGLSGSGKSCAVNALEDIGFYCIDNMPPQLISKFAEISTQSDIKIERVAIVADIRGGELFFSLSESIEELKEQGIDVKILFFDASDDILVKRFKETRRKHPLDEVVHGSIRRAVASERDILNSIRAVADYYIDTSYLSTAQLREQINGMFLENAGDSMLVKVMSFGFKYGAPNEADLLFDVRCLPNPFYIPELKHFTGEDSEVSDYVMSFEQSQELLSRLENLIDFLIPLYIQEGKSQLVIAFGCTGGKHRSVTFAEKIYGYLNDKNIRVRKSHRDISKDRYPKVNIMD
ncbi:MAG: RNase adapter RapZ [Ruminococcus sp.]|nr:RNase adapter RapZ [Ruminococcus sp.]